MTVSCGSAMAAEVALFENFFLGALLTEQPPISGTFLLERPWLMSLRSCIAEVLLFVSESPRKS